MFEHRFGPAFGRPPFGRGPWGAPWWSGAQEWGRPHHHGRRGFGGAYGYGRRGFGGRGWWLPLAAAFLARAAFRRRFGHGQHEHQQRGPWGRGDWGGPFGRGFWGSDAPWGRDRRHHGPGHEHGPSRGEAGNVRDEFGSLIGALRDAYRRGGIDERQRNDIRAVLADARKRITAILSERNAHITEL